MIKEKEVISLEIAQQLDGLGVKKESRYLWRLDRDGADDFVSELVQNTQLNRVKSLDNVAAYTIGELGEMLPVGYRSFQKFAGATTVWRCESSNSVNDDHWPVEADTEADARGKMLAYLVGTKAITL